MSDASETSSVLPSTGELTEYSTGAVRDASKGKGHFADIPACALRALAKRFEDGAAKYDRLNWAQGIPLSHYYNSLTRHAMAWAEGQTDEDHAGAVLWNMACAMWTDTESQAGRLPKELDDLPFRNPVSVTQNPEQAADTRYAPVYRGMGGGYEVPLLGSDDFLRFVPAHTTPGWQLERVGASEDRVRIPGKALCIEIGGQPANHAKMKIGSARYENGEFCLQPPYGGFVCKWFMDSVDAYVDHAELVDAN